MRYVLEVDRTGSISQAADNLFMGQPNLSKAIKELEQSLGIRIFKRTSKGVNTTASGEQLLADIKRIIDQIEEVEARYRTNRTHVQSLSISVPHCWYYSRAFAEFVSEIDTRQEIQLDFKETDSQQAINNVVEQERHIGIIRYHAGCEPYFLQLLSDQNLQHLRLLEFESRLLFSREHPLARKEAIVHSDLSGFLEISHGGCTIAEHPHGIQCKAMSKDCNHKISVHERGSQLELLASSPNTYMWAALMPEDMLTRHGLVQQTCSSSRHLCRDLLIFPHGYTTSRLEEHFLQIAKLTTKNMLATK